MTPDVDDLIDQARGLDPSFDPLSHPDSVLYRFVERYHRTLLGKVAVYDDTILTGQVTLSLPFSSFAAGESLTLTSGYTRIVKVEVQREGNTVDWFPFRLIDISDADRFGVPSGWIRDGNLFLTGRAEDWTGHTSIRVTYVPLLGTVTGATDLLFEDSAEDVFVAQIGFFLGKRTPAQLEPGKLAMLREDAMAAEQDFLRFVRNREGVVVTSVREVY